jgi:hypothetical protein
MRMSTRVYHIYILSYFGLFCLFNLFKEERWFDLKVADMDRSRPTHWAIWNGIDLENTNLTV